ncbi:MAG: hypothetical protein E4G94_00625 [ANME-2 cluster archaeon]|nr:MAG: hypothetical protein E4G94_00625 [ANME-2 cluster archaeon]
MITEALKNWLATNAGIGNCFSPTGISYKDPDGIARIGSTGEVLNAFVVANLVGLTSAIIIANTNYTQLKAINGGNDIAITDVAFAYNNDGSPTGEPIYCAAACTPNWTCIIPLNGLESDGCGNTRANTACAPSASDPAGTYVFTQPPSGQPTLVLNLANLIMKQSSTDYHFEMNDIEVTSTSPVDMYISLEVKLFPGALGSCPTTNPIFKGMDRVSTSRAARIILLNSGEVDTINADFYQPGSLVGVHTVCLLIHGAWARADLEAEIAPITG